VDKLLALVATGTFRLARVENEKLGDNQRLDRSQRCPFARMRDLTQRRHERLFDNHGVAR